MAILVDTNVLIDITTRGSPWLRWSRLQVEKAWKAGSIVINQVIYSEFAIRYHTMEEVDMLLPEDEFRREGLPFEAAFAAARAFSAYRRAGGTREKTLPDFLIGAHAAIRGYPILTRDPGGYSRYFPGVELITPDTYS